MVYNSPMPYRKIVDCRTSKEADTASNNSHGFTWRRGIDVYTVTLECGHKKVYRGQAPSYRAMCKECERP